MEREVATILLNKLVDEQILDAKEEVERKIERAVDEKFSEAKQALMDTVDRILVERILTGREAILAVLEKAAADSDFMAHLTENPEEALQGYGLTPEEKAAINSGDIQKIEEWAGKLTHEQSKWLWARLQQERW
jgi:hypothetical protein